MTLAQETQHFTSEAALAIHLHMTELRKEFERIVRSTKAITRNYNQDTENKRALELIKLKISSCEEGLNLIQEVF